MTDIQYCENCQGSGHIIAPMEDFLVKAHPCMVCTGTGVTDLQPSDPKTPRAGRLRRNQRLQGRNDRTMGNNRADMHTKLGSKHSATKSITVTPDMIVGNYELKVDLKKSKPKLKRNEYQCANCLEIYEYGWSDAEAEAEYEENFPNSASAGVERDIVCDDCYRQMVAWKPPKEADAELNGLVPSDSEADTDSSNSPTEATQERKES